MKINAHTKVSEVIKASPQAIDALVSVSEKFSKLKNPFLRKMMAPRVNLKQAAKIGGVRIDDLFIVLTPLGFEIDFPNKGDEKGNSYKEKVPAFVADIKSPEVFILDVRPILAEGKDPLNHILSNLKDVKAGQIFCIINTFEPIPLIQLLEKKGHQSYVKYVGMEEVHTYFQKNSIQTPVEDTKKTLPGKEDFSSILNSYKDNVTETDVRNLEMPLPMLTILELLETLPKNKILYVHHKRIPVYLLPEIENKGFEYFINEIAEGEVKMIIRHKL